MDFFTRQDSARRKTRVLVAYFLIAVVLTATAVNAAVYLLLLWGGMESAALQDYLRRPLWLWVAAGTIAVIAGGSLLRLWQLRGGGRAVAEMAGGRLLSPATKEPSERRLFNIVEEMAIASGVPVPDVYVLDGEEGINAFVAGFRPTETVLAVTRGALESLSRDELQGVVGHEFSHVFNGDMRINVRLIGILAGILAIGQMGQLLLRSLRHVGSGRRSGRSGSGGGGLFFVGLGLALLLVGYVGLFFGRLIKAAIARQREFLADASGVQFTRNPAGLAGALVRIRDHSGGSRLEGAHAEEMSHMCFGATLRQAFGGLLATHPPLEERIRAIDPSFLAHRPSRPTRQAPGEAPAGAAGLAGGETAYRATPTELSASVGNPTPAHGVYAAALHASIPPRLLSALHSPRGAQAVVCTLLLGGDPRQRREGERLLQEREGNDLAGLAAQFHPQVESLGPAGRLPLVELALPALRQLDEKQRGAFFKTVEALSRLDGRLSLFEYVLRTLLSHHLSQQTGNSDRVRFRSLAPVMEDARRLLSALAGVGAAGAGQAEEAYTRGVKRLGELSGDILPQSAWGPAQLDGALERLASLAPLLKKRLLEACADCVVADGEVAVAEAELLRAIADRLDCPLPPLLNSA